MDAEIARLRADATAFDQYPCLLLEKEKILSLLDALEQARKERDEAWTAVRVRDDQINVTVKKLTAQRDQAQQSAKDARALLRESKSYVASRAAEERSTTLEAKRSTYYNHVPAHLLARIEAMLEQKP